MEKLELIYNFLAQVGDLQYSIDVGEGDEILLWQEIGAIDHQLRRLANALPDEIFYRLPNLAKFTLSSQPIFYSWSDCRDEIGIVLAGIAQY